jgi:hypothetical protein
MKSSAVVLPEDGSKSDAAAVTKMAGGGLLLSPLPLSGGRSKTRRLSKKVLKMLKKMPKAKLAKLMKGGEEAMEEITAPETPVAPAMGKGRTRKGRKGGKSRKGSSKRGFLY